MLGRGGWGEGGVRVEQSPPKIQARGASLMLWTLSQLQGGNCIATRAWLSQESSAKGVMSLILLSASLQWVFSLSCCGFFPRDRQAQWDNLVLQVNLA